MNKLNVSNLPATNKRHPSAPNEIYVGNLSFFCSEDHLTELFSQYGGVKSCRIICGRSRKRSLSFGFVEMPTLQHANEAVAALDGHLFMGRNLR
jgi:RNA recognition motif-containing protein